VFLPVLAERLFDLRLRRWQCFAVTITAAGLPVIGLTGSGAAEPQRSSLAALIAAEGASSSARSHQLRPGVEVIALPPRSPSGGILVFDEPIGSGPLAIGARWLAFQPRHGRRSTHPRPARRPARARPEHAPDQPHRRADRRTGCSPLGRRLRSATGSLDRGLAPVHLA
jgi:hypothetical protein